MSSEELEAQINRIAIKQLLNRKIEENMKFLLESKNMKKLDEKKENANKLENEFKAKFLGFKNT